MNYKEEFEKETSETWFINPVCHGDYGFCSDEYMLWLEFRLKDSQEKVRQLSDYIKSMED